MTRLSHPSTTDNVRRQYREFPYPMRDPRDETKRLISSNLDELAAVNHYCYGGRRDFRTDFRVLVAGGGTGDATIFLAEQLRDTDAEIVHLDLSDTSLQIANSRARHRGLSERICWKNGSLLDLGKMNLGTFDYINCCGVLHHLDDPVAGLRALRSVLKDDGAIGAMVYGRFGRTGVYQMQELLRLANHDEDDQQVKVDNARAMAELLPQTNWFHRAGIASPDMATDAGLYDLLLHAKDEPFSVPQVYELLDTTDCHLVEFAPTFRQFYDIQIAIKERELLAKLRRLPVILQQTAAELFWGSISKHMFWISPRQESRIDVADPDNIPLFGWAARQIDLQQSLLECEGKTATIKDSEPTAASVELHMPINPTAKSFLRQVDGHHTVRQIVQSILDKGASSQTDSDAVWQTCAHIIGTLGRKDYLLLRHVSVPENGLA